MGKTLVIAEKPSVGRDIAAALPGAFAKSETYLESDEYVITWAVGHLVELAQPEDYDEKLKRWRMADLPIVPDDFRLKPRDAKSKKQLTAIRKLLERDDVDRVVNACDAGREGELIFAYIYESTGARKPVDRLWISSMTKQAIREGFERLRPGEQLRPLEQAARSRSEAYWLVRAEFQPPYAGLWFEGDETRIKEGARADEIVERVSGKDGEVESVERKEQSERAPLLYDLTSLQRDANRRFGFSARRTLQAAQSLYEGKKAITYPRTSSRYLSGDLVPQLKPTAQTLLPIPDYAQAAQFVLDLAELPLGRVVNDARVDDHHAIIPTDIEHDLADFSPDERRVFDLVAKRFLAVFHPPARYQRTTVITFVEDERFRTRGKITLEAGWRAVYGLESEEEKLARQEEEGPDDSTAEIPPLERGQAVRCVEAEVEAKETKPPPRYTEATLLSAMETAGKLIDDEELREAMKDSGLGTPATRAEMIETLIRREYIERVGKDLQPTPKGLQVITMLEEHKITSPELTGDWEKRLSDIEHGKGDRTAFMKEIESFAGEIVEQIAETGEIIKENSRAYGCTSWKSREETGCGYVIWKRVAGRTITPEVARQLIEEGRTKDVLSGFRSRNGKPFRARLVLNEEGKIEFEFPARKSAEPAQTAEPAAAE